MQLKNGGVMMNVRLAVIEELSQLKKMYKDIIRNMEEHDINIWDDIYPCEFLAEDIKHNRLYLLTDQNEIISAFALCNANADSHQVTWSDNQAKALYIDRLGVNTAYLNKGMGLLTLEKASELTNNKGFDYLRLFVVDENIPAINLYKKAGFQQAGGVYDEVIDDDLTLHEFGFELKTNCV